MVKTPSTMIPLGTIAPDFVLLDTVTNTERSLTELRSDIATVIMFLCNHCPYVKLIQHKLVEIANKYQKKGISFIAISSNDSTTHPQDGPVEMHKEAEKNHYSFPYLFDETQAIAKAYQAACTPDLFIFDKDLRCIYRGRFDEATPGNQKTVTGIDLTDALDNVLKGMPVSEHQQPSIGCNIKWRAD